MQIPRGVVFIGVAALAAGCATTTPPVPIPTTPPIASSVTPPTPPPAPPSRAPRTPEDCDRVFAERMNAGDAEGLLALYEPDATLVRTDGTPATGTAAIRQEIAGFMALKPKIVMHVKQAFNGGDVAVLYNDWQLTGVGPKGKRLKLSGRANEIVRRQADGTWKYVIDDPDGRGRRR